MDIMNDFDTDTIEFNSYGYNKYPVSRTLWVDNKSTPKYKYAEKIIFDQHSGDKFAICIGLNPAAAEQNIDETNKRLINVLKEEYKGYFLLNLYPEITDNKLQINYEDDENISFIHRLEAILAAEDKVSLDIILFFGRTTVLSQDQQELINSLVNNSSRNVYITTHGGEFTHPGSNAQIDKTKMEAVYLRQSTCIRVNP